MVSSSPPLFLHDALITINVMRILYSCTLLEIKRILHQAYSQIYLRRSLNHSYGRPSTHETCIDLRPRSDARIQK